jgi:hypothetical protein
MSEATEVLRLIDGALADLQQWSTEADHKARDEVKQGDPDGLAEYHRGRGRAYAGAAQRLRELQRAVSDTLLHAQPDPVDDSETGGHKEATR